MEKAELLTNEEAAKWQELKERDTANKPVQTKMEWYARYVVARQFRGAGSAMNVDRDGGKRRTDMTVKELEEFLKNVNDKSKTVYFYHQEDNPFNDGIGTVNVFEVSKDEENTGNFEGVYIQGC